jgi:hypothetical protein
MLHSFEKNLGQPAMGLEDLIRQEVHGLALADHDLIPRALEVRDLFLVTLDLQQQDLSRLLNQNKHNSIELTHKGINVHIWIH